MDNQRIRVIHIITKLELGGAQQNTLFTVEKLDRSSYEPVLITGKQGILIPQARSLKGVKCIFVKALRRRIRPVMDLAAFFHLSFILLREKRENQRIIVHTHSSKVGILGRWAAFAAGIPTIIHSVHGFGFHDNQNPFVKKIFILLERVTAKITSQIVFVSQANFKQAVRIGICRKNGQGRVIRSGIDLNRFRADQNIMTRRRNGERERRSSPLIGMIACFKPQKSPLDFVYMAARVSKIFPQARFMMVGDGQLQPQIRKLAEKLRLKERLILAGWRQDIELIYPTLDVFVLTSLWEGLPRVLVEATAAEIPIVATCIDGNREIVRNGVNGYLVPPRNPSALAEKVISLLRNPEQLSRTEENRQDLLDDFDIYSMVKQQEQMYLELSTLKNV